MKANKRSKSPERGPIWRIEINKKLLSPEGNFENSWFDESNIGEKHIWDVVRNRKLISPERFFQFQWFDSENIMNNEREIWAVVSRDKFVGPETYFVSKLFDENKPLIFNRVKRRRFEE
jgi:hypothetical protein